MCVPHTVPERGKSVKRYLIEGWKCFEKIAVKYIKSDRSCWRFQWDLSKVYVCNVIDPVDL